MKSARSLTKVLKGPAMHKSLNYYALVIQLTIFLLFGLELSCQAQGITDVPEAVKGVGVLPEGGNGVPTGTLIDSSSISSFKAIIPRELVGLIKSGELVLDSASRLHYVWSYNDSRSDQELSKTQKVSLTSSGSIEGDWRPSQTLLFGTPENQLIEWNNLDSLGGNPKIINAAKTELGYKILWNLSSLWASQGLLDMVLRQRWFDAGQLFRTTEAKYTRVYPAILATQDTTKQLFREIIQFNYPAAINKYTWLSFRFRGDDEDMLWVSSPVNHKVRQLTGSNRGDGMAGSSLSPDDLLGWSGRVASIEVLGLELATYLAPFSGLEVIPLLESPDSCVMPVGEKDRNSDYWNLESRRYPGAAQWMPTQVVFVPRRLWRIEVRSRDPYSLNGRQVIYLDAYSNLPVYRIVYDRAGRLWKTSISGFGLAATGNRSRKAPSTSWMLILDHQAKKQMAIEYDKMRLCRGFPSNIELAQFDPRHLQ